MKASKYLGWKGQHFTAEQAGGRKREVGNYMPKDTLGYQLNKNEAIFGWSTNKRLSFIGLTVQNRKSSCHWNVKLSCEAHFVRGWKHNFPAISSDSTCEATFPKATCLEVATPEFGCHLLITSLSTSPFSFTPPRWIFWKMPSPNSQWQLLLVTKHPKIPSLSSTKKNTSHPQPIGPSCHHCPSCPSAQGPPSSLRWGYKPKHLKLEPDKNTERWSPWVKEPPSRVIHPQKIHMSNQKNDGFGRWISFQNWWFVGSMLNFPWWSFPLNPGCFIGIMISWFMKESPHNWVVCHPSINPSKNRFFHYTVGWMFTQTPPRKWTNVSHEKRGDPCQKEWMVF